MYSNMEDGPPEVKKEYSTSPRPSRKLHKKSLDISEVDVEDASDQSTENALVLYNPSSSASSQNEIAISENVENQASPIQNFVVSNPANRVLPSVGAFTVQCATCFKWRLIPTKEKYEEIRETILQEPFVCESAREWRPDITCDDPPDICQDGSRLWAIDKPNIAQPPPGWERLLRIRGEGSTKFADVYYAAPSGKRLRSMVEVQKYLLEHPEFIEQGVTLSQFSFQIPKPLQENYVRKRSNRAPQLCDDGSGLGFQRPLEPDEANPLSWAAPPTPGDLQLGAPGMPSAYLEPPVDDRPLKQPRPAKKKAAKPSPKQPKHRRSTSPMQRDIQLDEPESPAPPVESPIDDDAPCKQPQPPPRRLKKKVARPPSKQQMYSSSNSSVYDQDANNRDPEDRNATLYDL